MGRSVARIETGDRRKENMKLKLKLFTLLAAVAPMASYAWIDTGHMAVAAIAERDLKPEVRAEIETLLQIGGDERTRGFYCAACWADDTRNRENAPWHYINHYFRTDGKPAQGKPLEENAVWAINKFTAVLADRDAQPEARADALRYVLHFVGDLHQPLHAVARETDERPQGDRGGNDFAITPPAGMPGAPKNLHFLWDAGAGLFPRIERPLSERGKTRLMAIVDEIVKAHPRDSFKDQVAILDPWQWSLECLELAKTVVYNLEEGSEPSAEYLAEARKTSARQAALAGYRLADLLNRTLAR
jgi:hypothetical protein